MEQTSINSPLEQLKLLRQEAQIAQTLAGIRVIHQRISVEIRRVFQQNPDIGLNEIAEALGTTVERVRKGSRLRVYNALKALNSGLFDTTGLPQDLQDQEDELGEDGIYFESVDKVITPPDENTREFSRGEGHGIEEKQVYERVKYVKEVLQIMKIDLFNCKFLYGTTTDKMMRKITYVLVKIPQLNKMVLVCDEEGNRTFVIYTAENEQKYIDMTKDELKDDPNVRHFKWNSDVDAWKKKLMSLLNNIEPEVSVTLPVSPKENLNSATKEKKINKFGVEYFTPENIRADLIEFSKEFSKNNAKEIEPLELNTGKISRLEIVCRNGEKCKGQRYLSRAGVALGIGKNTMESSSKQAETIIKLLILAGYKVEPFSKEMGPEYFTPENVKADLEAFASTLGEGKTPLDLSTSNIKYKEIISQSGMHVKGYTYLNRAAIAVINEPKKLKAQCKHAEILYKLLKLGGFERKRGYLKMMNLEYFTSENVKADLEAFARQLGGTNISITLNASNIYDIEITCCNGETIKGASYLYRARILLREDLKTIKNQYKRTEVFKILLKLAGYEEKEYPKMDKGYFTTENVKMDLQEFARVLGENKTPLDINTSNFFDLSINCCNKETVNGRIYFSRARIALKLAKDKKQKDIINTLLKLAGYEKKEYHKMDKGYFTADNVKTDIGKYISLLDEHKTFLDLNSRELRSFEVVCCNGETVNGNTYILRAGVALGIVENNQKSQNQFKHILIEVLKLAGYEYIEYPPMNKEYFSYENIKADLEAFANTLGEDKKTSDLTSNNIKDKEIICCNGEKVKMKSYLYRAGLRLGLVKNPKEASTSQSAVLNKLLEIVGIEKKLYPLMDRGYFSYKNIKVDLEAYAKAFGRNKLPEELRVDNLRLISISCCNGELVNGKTYLYRAGIALGMADRHEKINTVKVLKVLFKMVGYQIKEYPKMDADYFTVENIKMDLESYARALGEGKKISDLNLGVFRSKECICRNGESVKWYTYLHRASIGLGFAQNTEEASDKLHETMNKLFILAGCNPDSTD